MLENQLRTLQWNHSSVATTYFTIGLVNQKDKDYKQALHYFHKILEIELSKKEHDDIWLGKALKRIGDLYLEEENNDQALVLYLRYLNNELERNLYEHASLIDIYKIIANIYYRKR